MIDCYSCCCRHKKKTKPSKPTIQEVYSIAVIAGVSDETELEEIKINKEG